MRIVLAALALIGAAEPASACHHYSIWKNPWPQRCPSKSVYFRPKSVPIRPSPSAPVEDRSWYVEITRLPDLPVPEDLERAAAVSRLKGLMR